jgi:hypothetical protein
LTRYGTGRRIPGSHVCHRDSRITGNRATNLGGGIANFGTLIVCDRTVVGNAAPRW